MLTSIESADVESPAASPTPYKGIQYVDIPEFQAIGTQVGQRMAEALAEKVPVDKALKDRRLWPNGSCATSGISSKQAPQKGKDTKERNIMTSSVLNQRRQVTPR